MKVARKLINECSAFDFFSGDCGFLKIPFFKNRKPLDSKENVFAYLSLRSSGSMRFRYNEQNNNRERFFSSAGFDFSSVVPIELIHSKTVYALECRTDAKGLQGDGFITKNRALIPSVTVADCVPIFLYDPICGWFGIVHSGWKGTGIAAVAIKAASEKFGANPRDTLVVIGPHIHDCCYTVDEARAKYFAENFTTDCVVQNRLSLAKANIALLKSAGVDECNILHCTDCTCCDERLGSFRRECVNSEKQSNAPINFSNPNEPPRNFTPMAAFIN